VRAGGLASQLDAAASALIPVIVDTEVDRWEHLPEPGV
jgi:hypothetical protein